MFDVITGAKSTGVVSEGQEAEYYALRKGAETLFGIEIRGVLAEPLRSIVLKDDVFVALEVLALEQERIANDPMLVVVLKPGGGRIMYRDDDTSNCFTVDEVGNTRMMIADPGAPIAEELEPALDMLFDTTIEFLCYWANVAEGRFAKTDSHE
jgi:hypothetical protein